MSTEQKEFDLILGKVRARAISLLKDEKAAPDVCFALAYVATELGLSTANQPEKVFPLVLKAVTQASANWEQTSQPDPFDGLNASSPIQ